MCTPQRPSAGQDAPSVRQKVDFLSQVSTYGGRAYAVTVIQTHMSWLFVTDRLVYKFKKPVMYSFLDFSTLLARAADSRDEVILNRRLAPNVYLGLSCLVADDQGRLCLQDAAQVAQGSSGRIVEWLVRMRRLPTDATLASHIQRGTLTQEHIQSISVLLAAFYKKLPPAPLSAAQHITSLRAQQALNADMLRRPEFALDTLQREAVLTSLARWLDTNDALLYQRIQAGRVVEGHGDLRPEHIFLTQPPVVIDGLEFDQILRCVDWADEIAFLGLECAHMGAPHLGPQLRACVQKTLGDHALPDALFHFYSAFRACVRARLALAHLLDPKPTTPEKWPHVAHTYLACAYTHIKKMGLV